MTELSLLAGLAGLYFGAEWLVRGASRIAAALDVSPLVIGLTVVAFGTSMPEMVAGSVAAWNGNTDLVLGNVLGSNIANIGLILGLAAMIRAVPVKLQLLRREMPLMLLATVAVWALAARGSIGRLEGVLLFAALCGFSWLTLIWARRERASVEREFERFGHGLGLNEPSTLRVEIAWVIAGLGALTLGAHLLVASAVEIAMRFGVSEFLISVTMVALGTSLPELATSLIAMVRGESDVLVGNIVGSNIFNLLGALGVSAMIRPIPVAPEIVGYDLPVVLGFSLLMMATLFLHRAMVRWEGALLLGGYLAYIALLFR